MQVTNEQKEEYKAVINSALIFHPYISTFRLHEQLERQDPPLHLDLDYLYKLVAEVKLEKTQRYLQATKDEVVSQFEDLVEYVNTQLRRIANEEKIVEKTSGESAKSRVFSQRNRIEALKSIVANYEKLNNMKMDLGVLERKLGSIKADFRVLDVLQAVKEYVKSGGQNNNGGTSITPPATV